MSLLLTVLIQGAAAAALALPATWLSNRTLSALTGRAPPASTLICAPILALLLVAGLILGPGWPWALATIALTWVLATLALIDISVLRLPDPLTLPLIGVGLAISPWLPDPDPVGHLAGAVVGFCALAAIAILYRRVRGRDGLGLGDAKLMAAGGAWLGWQALPTVLLLACGGAMLWLVFLALRRRSLAMDQPLAFGVPLSAAIWLVWLLGPFAAGLN